MKSRMFALLFFLVFSAIFLSTIPGNVYATSISVSGKAKVINVDNSFLNFTLYNSNVKVDDGTGTFSGYAWLEDIGWVAFGTTDNAEGPVTLNLTTGAITGKAKILNTGGFLYFTTNNSNVTVALTTGIFSGYVWSEDVGWIDFTNTGVSSTSFLPTPSNDSESSSNNSSSTSTPSCTDQVPGSKPPWLYGAIAQDSGSVLLYFTEADNPVNKYVLEYGTRSGDYTYGVQDMGVNSRGQMTYLVKSLSPNTTYYFKVRGGNGCATGSWSNEISAKTKKLVSFGQLEITQSQLEPQPVIETLSSASCQTYTVKDGDTLWSISKKILGDEHKYEEIIEQNKKIYISLENSNSLNSGWKLQVNCKKQIDETQKLVETETQTGYDVKVKVVDVNKKPIEGAIVTMHSNPQTIKTDKYGVAFFSNIEAGDHKVLIAYKNKAGEQSINLTGNVKEFYLNVTIQQKAIALSPLAVGIIGVMSLIIIGLIFSLIKNKSRAHKNEN